MADEVVAHRVNSRRWPLWASVTLAPGKRNGCRFVWLEHLVLAVGDAADVGDHTPGADLLRQALRLRSKTGSEVTL